MHRDSCCNGGVIHGPGHNKPVVGMDLVEYDILPVERNIAQARTSPSRKQDCIIVLLTRSG